MTSSIYRRRSPSVSQDYGFASRLIEQYLWWLKRPIFEWQSVWHRSHLKIVLGSVTVPMAFLIFLFSTCRLFSVFSACLIPSSLFYKMPPCRAIFDHKLPTFYVNGCRLHIPLANIFEAKEWAASFTCTFFKLAVEEVLWNPSFSHPAYVTQPSKASLAE